MMTDTALPTFRTASSSFLLFSTLLLLLYGISTTESEHISGCDIYNSREPFQWPASLGARALPVHASTVDDTRATLRPRCTGQTEGNKEERRRQYCTKQT